MKIALKTLAAIYFIGAVQAAVLENWDFALFCLFGSVAYITFLKIRRYNEEYK